MLPLLLAVCLAGPVQDDVVTLKHGVKYEFTLGPDDPVLEGVGPSKTFRYEVEAEDSVLFIWAESEQADLVLHAKFGAPASARQAKPKASGAAGLLAGRKKPEASFEDDDSGGGTTPFLTLETRGVETVTVRVATKSLSPSTTASIHVFEAYETDATREAAAAGRRALSDNQRLAETESADQQRSRIDAAIVEVLAPEKEPHSPALTEIALSLGFTAFRLGALQGAQTAVDRAYRFRIRALPEHHRDLQAARANLAAILQSLGDLSQALELQEVTLEVCRRTLPEHHPDLQGVRGNLAMTLKDLGELARARDLEEKVLASFEKSLPPDHPNLQRARMHLASTLKLVGELRAAVTLEKQVLEIHTRTLPEDHALLQAARLNLAVSIQDLGDLEGARELEERAQAVLSRTHPADHPDLQTARMNLAITLSKLGELGSARALEEQVLKIRIRTLPNEHPDLQAIRLNYAATLRALGDLVQARVLEEKALSVLSRSLPEDHPTLQTARQNLAATLKCFGQPEQARLLEEQVLSISSRKLPDDHPALQLARANLALTLLELGEVEAARVLQTKVLELHSHRLPDHHPDLQRARGNLAQTMKKLGNWKEARALEEQVLEVFSQTLPSDHPDLQLARASLARLLMTTGEGRKGQTLARKIAGATAQRSASWQTSGAREIERQSFWEIDTPLSIAAGAGEFSADPEGERLCFSMCEVLRMAEVSSARLQRSLGSDQNSQALQTLARTSRELNTLAGATGEDGSRFSELVRERDRLRRELLGRLEEAGADRFQPEVEAQSIAERLRPEEAAIAYWRYERWEIAPQTRERTTTPSYLAWVLTPDGSCDRIELGSAQYIDAAIREWRAALQAPARGVTGSETTTTAIQDEGRRVRSLIFDPLRDELGAARRVWVAAAEALHLVPLDAMPEHAGVLGDHLEFAHLQAVSELTLGERPALAPPSVLAMGGIRYDGQAVARSIASVSNDSRGASRSAFSGGNYEWTFGRLPGTRGEAEAVGEYFLDAFEDTGAPEPEVLTRSKASREAFERLAPKARYVHLATHGWFAPESVASTTDDRVIDQRMGLAGSSLRDQVIGLAPSLLCGLAFAGANGEADMYGRVRGVMTAEEISAMDLTGVELCVLSACETNVGVRRGGQGIASLQTALHAAGVRTAITSLWKVPDEATRELMTEFYRRLWVLKEPKAKALWNAKKKLREQLDADGQPIYTIRDWAGWVLSGDPD